MYVRIQIYFDGRGRGGSQGIVLFARRKGWGPRPHLYIYLLCNFDTFKFSGGRGVRTTPLPPPLRIIEYDE